MIQWGAQLKYIFILYTKLCCKSQRIEVLLLSVRFYTILTKSSNGDLRPPTTFNTLHLSFEAVGISSTPTIHKLSTLPGYVIIVPQRLVSQTVASDIWQATNVVCKIKCYVSDHHSLMFFFMICQQGARVAHIPITRVT